MFVLQAVGQKTAQNDSEIAKKITSLKTGDYVLYSIKGDPHPRIGMVVGFGTDNHKPTVQIDNAGMNDLNYKFYPYEGRIHVGYTNYNPGAFTALDKLVPGKTKLKVEYRTVENLKTCQELTVTFEKINYAIPANMPHIWRDKVIAKDDEGNEISYRAPFISNMTIVNEEAKKAPAQPKTIELPKPVPVKKDTIKATPKKVEETGPKHIE
jgi:hypothetical protein